MNCSEARDLIPQYCNRELDDDTRRQLEKHISGCSECRDDLKGEQEFGRMIGKSAADDPPDEYWNDYSAKVRSRIRATAGMFWRLGFLPGCLAGAFGGLLFSAVFVWLFPRHGLGSVHPAWFRAILEFLIVIATGAAFVIPTMFLFRKVNRRVLPCYERDEMNLKRAIAGNPAYRRIVIVLLMVVYVGLAVFATFFFTGLQWHIPKWAINTLRAVMLIGFTVGIPSLYMTVRAYLDGWHLLAEWCQKYRKGILLTNTLLYLVPFAVFAAGVWNLIIIAR